jgi:hypothetical protein
VKICRAMGTGIIEDVILISAVFPSNFPGVLFAALIQ